MLVALLVAAAAAHSADPLQSALLAAHRDYMAQQTDKFAETTADPGVIGKSFKLVRSLGDGDSLSGVRGPFYTYKDGKLRLYFDLDSHMIGEIGGRRTVERSYVGSNAFGVTRRVQVVRLDEDGVAMFNRPEGEVSPYEASIRANDLPAIQNMLPPPVKDSYWVELSLPGPEARKVATDSALVIEGTIAPLEGGKLSICKSIYIEAEIDAPNEIYGSDCMVGANVRRIAFIRKSTGEVLKEWVK